jgi:prepilin-type processing-associated H-X9-DG protein
VNAARESARKMSCSNNLHNLVIAVINYHDTLNTYPNGTFYNQNPNDSVCQGAAALCEQYGWPVLIMPYIEQQNLHTQLGVTSYSLHHLMAGANPGLKNPTQLLQTKLSIFICPSDSNPNGNVNATRNFNTALGTTAGGFGAFQPGISNYIGNRGTRFQAYSAGQPDTFGIFMEVYSKRMQDITDGSSNTIMLGERDTQICNSATWVGVRNPAGSGTAAYSMVAATSHVKLNTPDPPIAWNDTTVGGCFQGFSSLHPGGANFALCDGSVRFVTNGIEYKPDIGTLHTYDKHVPRNQAYTNVYSVYTRLMRRNDGFPIGDF